MLHFCHCLCVIFLSQGSHVRYSPSSPPMVYVPVQRSATRLHTSPHLVPKGIFKMNDAPAQLDSKYTEASAVICSLLKENKLMSFALL